MGKMARKVQRLSDDPAMHFIGSINDILMNTESKIQHGSTELDEVGNNFKKCVELAQSELEKNPRAGMDQVFGELCYLYTRICNKQHDFMQLLGIQKGSCRGINFFALFITCDYVDQND